MKGRLILLSLMLFFPKEGFSNEQYSTFLAPSDEALFLQRITEFWKDKDYALVAKQIEEFFETFPNSELTDRLLVLQGDLYSSQANYQMAVQCYGRIQDPQYQEKALFNKLSALFYLQRYSTLIQEACNVLQDAKSMESKEIARYYLGQAHLVLGRQSQSSQSHHYLEAKEAFESLQDNTYSLSAMNALIEIYNVLKLPELESQAYLTLAKKFPDKEEQFLLSAAQIQKNYLPEAALLTYLTIRELRGGLADQANKERLLLLFELNKYQEIADEVDIFQDWNRKIDGPLAPLLIGRSYYYLKRYEDAISCLEPLLNDFKSEENVALEENKSILKSILTPLIFSAHALNALSLEEEWIKDYEVFLGKDENYPEILFAHAMTYKNCDRFPEAESLFKQIAREYSDFDKSENISLELAILEFKKRNWEECQTLFLSFLNRYPLSEHKKSVWQYLASAADHRLNEAILKKEPLEVHHEQLIKSIETAFSIDAISNAQKPLFLLKLGDSLYAVGAFEKVVELLKSYPEDYVQDSRLDRVHLLLAGSYDQLKQPEHFIRHAEQALKCNKSLPERIQLQQNLFVNYLKLGNGEKISPEEKQKMFKLASNHLQDCLQENVSIPQKYLEWLANYYYQQAFHTPVQLSIEVFNAQAIEEKQFAKDSLHLYLNLLENGLKNKESLSTNQEADMLRLSNLYLALGQPVDSFEVLKLLADIQEQEKRISWKWRARVLYQLGKYYQANGNIDLALGAFKKAGEQKIDPFAIHAAQLAEMRLRNEFLTEEKRSLNSPEMLALLKKLKDLQRDKNALNEPIYLEASLEYAAIRASLENKEEQCPLYYSLLKRSKEEYLAEDDIHSKEYHRLLEENPKQKALFEAYMNLFDAHLSLLDAKIAALKNKSDEVVLKKKQATMLYRQILSDKFASKYLIDASQKGLYEVEAL